MSKEARLLSKRLKNRWATSVDNRANLSGVGGMKRFCRYGASFGRNVRRVSLLASVLGTTFFLLASSDALAATFRTSNFIVHADSAVFARQVGEAAEQYRKDLAILWLGEVLPNWSNPCVVTVKTGESLGPGGETVFTYCNNEVFDWKMTAQGSEARVLDSVLPHEITHTILASYLKAPAPRWIDEGMATSVEADAERTNYRTMLADYLHSRKGIAFNDMVAMKEYPVDLMPFYSQSFSVCEYLILIGGRRRLVEFAKEGARTNDWNGALRRYYEGRSLGDLQLEWVAWIGAWDAANRPTQLPKTPKLRDFNELRQEEMLASRTFSAETTARAQNVEPVATAPSNWKTTLGEAFDGVRSWGREDKNAQNKENLAVNGRDRRVETTAASDYEEPQDDAAKIRGERSREFGESRLVTPNKTTGQNAQTAQGASLGERRATIWVPRAGEAAVSGTTNRGTASSGVLSSGAGSATRANVW